MKNPNITIRKAVTADAAEVASLLGALGYPSSEAAVQKRLANFEASSESAVFVAELAGSVAGMISFHRIPMFHADGHLGRITSLVISLEHQRRGMGTLLVAALEEHAWQHDCVRLEVTSGDHRPDAHAFYERLGYRVDCRRFIKKRES